jgi:peptidoglycan/LPS O-acetylase OafA/YrhL
VAPVGTERGRDRAIDMAKGCAILWVLLIHSEALRGNLLFRQVVNQAVPVFVVLFGLNSSLWWRDRDLGRDWRPWYRRAVGRIMLPVWAILPVWWACALYYHPFGVWLSWWLPIVQVLGYLLYVGTGWFVTMIVQLVVLFPAFEWARRRVGLAVLLPLGLAVTVAVVWFGLEILGTLGPFNFLVFSPRYFGHVAFGMLLARQRERLGTGALALATAMFAACVASDLAAVGNPWVHEASWIGALALTVMLLVTLRWFAAVPLAAPGLAWLGRSSYGIYLGQLLTHNFFVYRYTIPGVLDGINRWLYTGILLGGGLFFVWVGEQLLRAAALLGATLSPRRKALDTP